MFRHQLTFVCHGILVLYISYYYFYKLLKINLKISITIIKSTSKENNQKLPFQAHNYKHQNPLYYLSVCEEVGQHEIKVMMACTAYGAACDAQRNKKNKFGGGGRKYSCQTRRGGINKQYNCRCGELPVPSCLCIVYLRQLIFNDNFVLIFFNNILSSHIIRHILLY